MDEEKTLDFSRSTAAFLIDALLYAVFAFVFFMGLDLGRIEAVIVALAGAIWQTLFTTWLLMYPFARLEDGFITFFARYQKREKVFLTDITGVLRDGNDIEISLKDGDPLSYSLFWMSPAQRDLLIQTLQP